MRESDDGTRIPTAGLRLLCAIVPLLLAPGVIAASAQGTSRPGTVDGPTLVRGRVDGDGGRALPPTVAISVDGRGVAFADSAGAFRVVASSGRHQLSVRALGFVPLDTSVEIAGARMFLALNLRSQATALDSVRIVAQREGKPPRYAMTTKYDAFYERRRSAIGGVFLTREDIDAANVMAATDIFRRLPGVQVRRYGASVPSIRFERCSGGSSGLPGADKDEKQVQLFIDGSKVGDPFGTIDLLKSADIEAIEVYQGVAQLPSVARGDGCAAIFIWTRLSASRADSKP